MLLTDNSRSVVFTSKRPGDNPSQFVFVPNAPYQARIIYVPGGKLERYELKLVTVTELPGGGISHQVIMTQTKSMQMELIVKGDTLTATIHLADGLTFDATHSYQRTDEVFDGRYTPLPLKFDVLHLAETPHWRILVAREQVSRQHYVFWHGKRLAPYRVTELATSKQNGGGAISFKADGVPVTLSEHGGTFDGRAVTVLNKEDYTYTFRDDGSTVLIGSKHP